MNEEAHAGHHEEHHGRELIELECHGGAETADDDPVEERAREGLVPPPDAEEGEESHAESEADGGYRHPVRPAPEAASEREGDESARERQRGDWPDEVDHSCATIGCGRSAARGAPRAVTCALTLADPPGGVKARAR